MTWSVSCTSRSTGTRFFLDRMRLIDVYHYGTQHYDFHRRQLTIATTIS
jgi:hypothetical protein